MPFIESDEINRAAKAGFEFGWNAALKEAMKIAPVNAEAIRGLMVLAISARSEAFQPLLEERLNALGLKITKG
jgi:hypothetical protein